MKAKANSHLEQILFKIQKGLGMQFFLHKTLEQIFPKPRDSKENPNARIGYPDLKIRKIQFRTQRGFGILCFHFSVYSEKIPSHNNERILSRGLLKERGSPFFLTNPKQTMTLNTILFKTSKEFDSTSSVSNLAVGDKLRPILRTMLK